MNLLEVEVIKSRIKKYEDIISNEYAREQDKRDYSLISHAKSCCHTLNKWLKKAENGNNNI